MNRAALNNKRVSIALLISFFFLQLFALIHVSEHNIDFETRLLYTQKEEADLLHDSDSGCMMLNFYSLNHEGSSQAVYFVSLISSSALIVPPIVNEYISFLPGNYCNKAPPLFS
jgi:hypothetical protein